MMKDQNQLKLAKVALREEKTTLNQQKQASKVAEYTPAQKDHHLTFKCAFLFVCCCMHTIGFCTAILYRHRLGFAQQFYVYHWVRMRHMYGLPRFP